MIILIILLIFIIIFLLVSLKELKKQKEQLYIVNKKAIEINDELKEKGKQRESLISDLINQNTILSNMKERSNAAWEEQNSSLKSQIEKQKYTIELEINKLNQIKEEITTFSKKKDELTKTINQKESILEGYNQVLSEQLKNTDEYYMLDIGADKVAAIKQLHFVSKNYPEIANAINKVAYDVYIKSAVKQMTDRVVGLDKVSGIYKITNVLNGMSYIGQSVDIAKRWTTHIKRGCGVELGTKSPLYDAMEKDGVWNFKFMVVEITDDLTPQEKYWIEKYNTMEVGYNARRG